MTEHRKDLGRLAGVPNRMVKVREILQQAEQLVQETEDEMCAYLRSVTTAFSEFIRGNNNLDSRRHGLSIHDVDWVVHQFKTAEDKNGPRSVNNLMLLEEKRWNRVSHFAQQDTFQVLHQCLSAGHRRKIVNARGEKVIVRYFGFHTLTFSREGPLDSDRIWWNGHLVDLPTLERLIRFELDPRTRRERDITERRHHSNKANDTPLFLPVTRPPEAHS